MDNAEEYMRKTLAQKKKDFDNLKLMDLNRTSKKILRKN